MPSAGTKLGTYEILLQIGAGGMGEVELIWRRPSLASPAGGRQAKSRAQRGI